MTAAPLTAKLILMISLIHNIKPVAMPPAGSIIMKKDFNGLGELLAPGNADALLDYLSVKTSC